MFSVRRLSPRILTVLSLTGLGLVGLAGPASAHTAAFTRDCGSVTVNLTKFAQSTSEDPNVVEIFRDGAPFRTARFTSSSFTARYDQASTGTVTFEAKWTSTGADNASGDIKATLAAPSGCTPPCQEKGTFTYTFDGPSGRATVSLAGETPLCAPVTVLLASYRTQGPAAETSGHHTVADQVSQQITKPGRYPLAVRVPDCFAQVNLYVTDRRAADFDFPHDTLGEFLASTVWPEAGPPAMWNGGATAGGATACGGPTTPPPSPVAPTTVAPAGAAPGNSLPETGASPLPKVGLAALLLALGTTLVVLGRRRRTTQ